MSAGVVSEMEPSNKRRTDVGSRNTVVVDDDADGGDGRMGEGQEGAVEETMYLELESLCLACLATTEA